MVDIEEFLERESNFNLFDIKYKDIPVWELVRFDVFNSLSNREIITPSFSLLDKINIYMRIILKSIISNPLFYLSEKEILVIRASRKFFSQNQFIDPYTVDIEKNNQNEKVGIYESNIRLKQGNFFAPNILIMGIWATYFSKIISFFLKKNPSLEEAILKIGQVFPEKQLSGMVRTKVLQFIIVYKLYSYILEKRKPKKIYMTNYIFKLALIYAARQKNIRVIEIQHGFIVPHVVDYHFPSVEKGSLKLFPDEFHYLSKNLMHKVILPLKDADVQPFEGYFFSEKYKRYYRLEKNGNAILFISQIDSVEILDFIEELCKLVKNKGLDFCVYFKPHPFEYKYLNLEYIRTLTSQYNFVFISESEDIYKYLGEVRSVVGVYSSLLVEALDYGSKVYSLKIKGYQLFQDFIEADLVKLIETPLELLSFVQKES